MNIAAAMAVLATQFHDEGSVTAIDNLRIQWRFTILNPDQRGRARLRCVGHKSNIYGVIFSWNFNRYRGRAVQATGKGFRNFLRLR